VLADFVTDDSVSVTSLMARHGISSEEVSLRRLGHLIQDLAAGDRGSIVKYWASSEAAADFPVVNPVAMCILGI
jgi:hypothetical protein